MSNDQVEAHGWGMPRRFGKNISLNKSYTLAFQSFSRDSLLCQLKHRGACIHTYDLRPGVDLQKLAEKPSVAFAENEHAPGCSRFVEKRCPAFLQDSSGKHAFEPVIVWSERVEVDRRLVPQRK